MVDTSNLHKFLLQPDSSSYDVTDGKETISTQLDGGAGRYRADILNASYTVTVHWIFTPAQFNYFRAFYKGTAANRGSRPFLIDLMTDDATALITHTVYFVPGSVKTDSMIGGTYQVSASLEVIPVQYPDGYFDTAVLMYEIAGEDASNYDLAGVINPLDQLITVTMPGLPSFVYV